MDMPLGLAKIERIVDVPEDFDKFSGRSRCPSRHCSHRGSNVQAYAKSQNMRACVSACRHV